MTGSGLFFAGSGSWLLLPKKIGFQPFNLIFLSTSHLPCLKFLVFKYFYLKLNSFYQCGNKRRDYHSECFYLMWSRSLTFTPAPTSATLGIIYQLSSLQREFTSLSVVDPEPDPYCNRFHKLCGSGSVFRIRIRIQYTDPDPHV